MVYGRNLKLLNSSDLERTGASAGVALVLNRATTNVDDTQFTEIKPGHAIMITTKWHGTEALTILNIYAPNSPAHHPAFWEHITHEIAHRRLPKPDIVLGDFNLVEDTID